MKNLNNLERRVKKLSRDLRKEQENIIKVTDVSIKQLTIEVKVMKIGNRQVTLAVFRQLPEKQIIDPYTGKICGIPWGRVNYHVGCETMHYKHLHIVWQDGDELRRDIVSDWRLRGDGYIHYDPLKEASREELALIEPIWQQSYTQLEQLDQLFIAI